MYEQGAIRNVCKRNLQEHSLASHIKPVQRNMSSNKSEAKAQQKEISRPEHTHIQLRDTFREDAKRIRHEANR